MHLLILMLMYQVTHSNLETSGWKMSNSGGVSFISLGCPKNRIGAEVMLAVLDAKGCHITPDLKEARTVVVNTYAVVEEAE